MFFTRRKILKTIFLAVLGAGFFTTYSMYSIADAATILLTPSATSAKIGDTITLSVQLNTEDAYINATQATIHFPSGILEATSVSFRESIFNFWVKEPAISDADGTVTFIGGTAKGVSGSALPVASIVFKVKGIGNAEFTATDGVVTANDGKGTNVLSSVAGASVSVGAGTSTTLPQKTTSVPVSQPVVETPKPVIREARESSTLPAAPEIRVPLYPDQSRWYNQKGDVVALWDIPDDVTQLTTRLSRNRDRVPGIHEEELLNGKDFGVLTDDGVWNIRVQFRNNIGWGPLSYYSISLDTASPLPFQIRIEEAGSDNPSPILFFETNDSLSGISKYEILVDGKKILETSSTTIALPAQLPGTHELSVRAFDKAGNSTEDVDSFDILPIATPSIDFVTKTSAAGESVFLSGTAISNSFVEVRVLDKQGNVILTKNSNSDSEGNWTLEITESFPMGTYGVYGIAHDVRGARSLPSEPQVFKVKPKVVISLGLLELGWFEIFMVLVLMILVIAGMLLWYRFTANRSRYAYQIIVARDVDKIADSLEAQAAELEREIRGMKLTEQAKSEIGVFIKKVSETAGKMKKYLGKEVAKIK